MLKRLRDHVTGTSFGASFVRAAIGSGVAQACGMALALLVGILLAQTMGPHSLGVYSLAMSTVAVLCIPTEFGLPTYLLREIASAHVRRDWGYLKAVLTWCNRAVFILSVTVVSIVGLVLLLLPAVGSDELRMTVVAALPIVSFVALAKVREAAMQGINLQPLAQIPLLVLRPGFFLGGLLFASIALGLTLAPPDATLLHSISMAAVVFVGAAIYRTYAPREATAVAPDKIDRFAALRSAVPMAMTEGLRVANGHLAVFLLGWFSTLTAVGLFRVSDALSIVCALPVWVLNNVTAPQIARLHAGGEIDRLRKLVSFVGLAMTLGCFALAALLLALGGTILSQLFGEPFAEAKTPMLILCTGYVLAAVFGPATAFMNMTGREHEVTRSIGVAFATNLVLGSVFVPLAGAVGAAASNVASYLILSVWLWWQARRQAGIDTSLLPALATLLSARARA